MIWLGRSLIGPGLWALAFAAAYGLHGLGCAQGWADGGVGLVAHRLGMAGLALGVMDDPTQHARDALRGVLAGYVGLHALICGLIAAFALDQAWRGEGNAGARSGWRLWQDFASATGLVAIAAVMAGGMGG